MNSKKDKCKEINIMCRGEVMRAVDQIMPYEREARKHGPEQMEKLRASLRENGFMRPLTSRCALVLPPGLAGGKERDDLYGD